MRAAKVKVHSSPVKTVYYGGVCPALGVGGGKEKAIKKSTTQARESANANTTILTDRHKERGSPSH